MKNKAAIVFTVILAFVSIFIYWKNENNEAKENNSKLCFLNQYYTRAELEKLLLDAASEKQIIQFLGMPTRTECSDVQNNEMLYVYSYSPELLKKGDKSKYGTGIKIICKNGKIIHGDILELDVTSKIYTATELDQLIHHGLTGAEVKSILGEPKNILKIEELVIYCYMFPNENIKRENGSIPIGINVMFIDNKVVNWGIVRVAYGG